MDCVKNLIFLVFFPLAYTNIINLEVTKYIDITSQLVKIDEIILFKNVGPAQIQNYNYILDPDVTLVYVEFYTIEKLTYQIQNESLYIVNLEKSVFPNLNGVIKVEMVYLNKIVTLANYEREKRTVKYAGNLYFYSPYETVVYSATYHVNLMEILEVSIKPIHINKTDLVYEFQNVPTYMYKEIVIIYINDVPFFVVTKLDRLIDVSHLGSIFIEDSIDLLNEGPMLTKTHLSFLRRLQQILFTYLPASASNVQLFDDIGNNSKSSIIYEKNYITLRFEARYPLRQSWKTKYVLQYNVPAYEYLRKTKNLFLLKMRVVDHVLPDAIIRYGRTRILLPQDSEIVSVTTPSHIKRGADERSTTGLAPNRPTVVFNANNLPENFVPEFSITYTTPLLGAFKPAIYISAYIEAVLLSWIAFRRIDMYLTNL